MRRRFDRETETPWAAETLLYDGDAFFDRLLKDIEQARHSVELETYIYRDDQIGRRVAEALVQAAARGVDVRLIVDGIGASGWFERNAPLLESKGVRTRVYHPVLFHNLWTRIKIDLGLLTPPKSIERLRGSVLISRFNRRDHRKMALIDRQVAYIGSVNITDDHCASVRGPRAWRDTSVRLEGGPVGDILLAFDDVWERCHDAHASPRWRERLTRQKQRPLFSKFVRFNYTARLRKQSYRSLIRRIARAKSKVWITNPYFAPSASLMKALSKASKNGADVRILVPRHSDVFFMPWVATAYYGVVLKGGARVFEYLPRMLHAKTALIDNWITVGSSNFNRRSLVHDFEVDAVLSRPESHQSLAETYLKDLKQSEEVTVARVSGPIAFLGRLVSFLLKNWL